MQLPIPTHLGEYFTPVGEQNTEFEVTGYIECQCGNDIFETWESNDCQMIKVVCKHCGHEIVIFDAGRHGWNGFVCKEDFLERDLPYEKCNCEGCDGDGFNVKVYISSQGKEDFIEECLSNDDSFKEEDWVDAFEWITISLKCCECDNEEELVDFETM